MPFGIGWPEILVVLVIALLLFGPKRLPELGASVGKTITGFKRGLHESQEEIRTALQEGNEPAQAAAQPAAQIAPPADGAKASKE